MSVRNREFIGEGPVSLYTVPRYDGGALLVRESPLSNRLSNE